jgi:hypothetical protein
MCLCAPLMIVCEGGMVSLVYKHMRELRIRNNLTECHCFFYEQNLIGKDP